jgi:anti-sigma regulatory factor (Ser/Thr protein kinase)
MHTLKLLAKVEHLPQWMQFIAGCAQAYGLPSKRIREIELALEEVLVNVCQYAYPEDTGDVEVTCNVDAQQHFIINIIDQGIAFDPLALEAPDLTADVNSRQVGGLGVFLVRRLMDDVSYRRENDQNIMKLTVDPRLQR